MDGYMNANEIKWITANNLNLNPFYFSIPEKLDTFGYCVDLCGFGEDKADKAQLCIFDVANKKDNPNILIICPTGWKQSWYSCLLKGLGLEFKSVTGASDTILNFSPEMANLLIMDESVLAESNNSAYTPIKESEMIWDLLIIDAAGSIDGINPALYTENVGMKAEKLLVFAPYPSEYTKEPDEIKTIVKSILKDTNIADGVDSYKLDSKVMEFTMNTPFCNYPKERAEAKVNVIKYAFDEKDIPDNLRAEDIQNGTRYTTGGNIFEEYNLEERKIYLKPDLTKSDAEVLKNKDKKLEKFLAYIDPIINSTDKTAIVYFSSDGTKSYIEKVLSAVYYDKHAAISSFEKCRFDVKRLKQWYETEKGVGLRVVLANDNLSESFGVYEPITHIVNYEFPDNPVIFHQRYTRRGLMGGDNPEFTIFLDDNGIFDSRMLGKALAGNIYKAYRTNIPYENVIMNIDGIENVLADMLLNVKYVSDYTGEVSSSFDVINNFKQEYNIPAERNLTTAARTHEYALRKLEVLSKALGVSDITAEKTVDKAALTEKLTAVVTEIRSGYTYFDDGVLRTIPRSTIQTQEFKQFASYLDGNPFNLGLKTGRESLEKAVKGKNEFVYIKDAVSEVSDTLKPAVLYNTWQFWHKKLGIGGSYEEFIKAYNKGVI